MKIDMNNYDITEGSYTGSKYAKISCVKCLHDRDEHWYSTPDSGVYDYGKKPNSCFQNRCFCDSFRFKDFKYIIEEICKEEND